MAQSAPPGSGPHMTTSAVVVFTLFVAVGAASLYRATLQPEPTARAVPGAPGQRRAPAPQADLPSNHPPMELPEEVQTFLADLAAQATAAPEDVEIWQRLARARYRASMLDPRLRPGAAEAVAKLLTLDANNLEGLRITGNIDYDASRFAEAEKTFRRYLELEPDDPAVLTDLGSTLLFQQKAEEAIATYEQAIAADPGFMQAHFNLGLVYQQQGRTDDALASMNKAREAATDDAQRQRIDVAIAEIQGKPAPLPPAPPGGAPVPGAGAPSAMPPGGMPAMPSGPAPMRDVPTNAESDFQHQAEKELITHPIVGPRITGFVWKGPASGEVLLADFPMDQMPPFVRDKFKAGMAARLAELAGAQGVAESVSLALVDAPSGREMDRLTAAP